MIKQCVGVDIVEIQRIESAIFRWGERFLTRVFTPAELDLYRGKTLSLAVRFSAKEATIKALDIPGASLQDIEILAEENHHPRVCLHGTAKTKAAAMKITSLDLSLSHSKDLAIACVAGLYSDE